MKRSPKTSPMSFNQTFTSFDKKHFAKAPSPTATGSFSPRESSKNDKHKLSN